jgi:DNA-binding NtrC family response regulator
VRAGKFRSDLYHRLSVFAVHVPPLRDLAEDKQLLRNHFTEFYAKQIGQAPFVLDEAAQACWLDYKFPGNVRELRNIVIRLIAKYAGKTIKAKDLVAEFDLSEPESTGSNSESINFNDESSLMAQAQRHLQRQANVSLDEVLKTWEKAYIEAAMQMTHGNLSQAAKLLNVNRTTLYSRMSTTGEN